MSWVAQGMENIINAITSGLSNVYNTLLSFNNSVGNWFTNLGSSIGEFFGNLGSNISILFGDLGNNLGSWFSNLFTNLGNILSYINPFSENFLGYKLIEILQETLDYLFTPSEANITGLQTTVNEKFGFIDSIKIAISDIQDMIENIENGTSEFNLDIESDYYEGEVTILDLAWYVPFKPYGDLIFTGFAYVFFVWRLYKSIPNIINGVASTTGTITRGGGDE